MSDKKIVHYDTRMGVQLVEYSNGQGAMVYPVDHPDTWNVSNENVCFTSKVVSWDETSGRLETMNTIYLPYQETPA